MNTEIMIPFESVSSQYGININLNDVYKRLNIHPLWLNGYKGKGIKIGILDTGINSSHPMLNGQVVSKFNLTDGDIEDSIVGHGTHVASTVAGKLVNVDGVLVSGVAPHAFLVNIKVLNDSGSGSFSDIIEGIQIAIDEKCDIINMSLGASYDDNGKSPVSQAIDRASNLGIICIIASGNNGPGRSPNTPGTCKSAITVGSVNLENEVSSFSSRGPASKFPYPTICSFGGESVASGGYGNESILGAFKDGYNYLKGTSMATPQVTGIVALLKNKYKTLNYLQLLDILKNSSTDLSLEGPDNNSGYGLINASKAIKLRPLELPDAKHIFTNTGSVVLVVGALYVLYQILN